MGTIAAMIIGLVVGAIADHFLEARSIATLKKAIDDAKNEIIAAIRGKS